MIGGAKMSQWNYDVFQQDITKKNYMELADWIIACRSAIDKRDFDSYEKYISAVDMFCKEWEAFYHQNEAFFQSHHERFKKAVLFASYKKNITCTADYGTKEVIPSENIHNLSQSFFGERLIEEIDQDYSPVYDLVKDVFAFEDGYKARLHKVILDQIFRLYSIQIRVFDDKGAWIKAATYDEFIKKCETQKYHIDLVPMHRKNSYYKVFEEYDIVPSVYGDFISENACEQEFGKKFFVNLGFALSLNLTLVEKLLNYNGYSIKNKSRQFDIICEKAFRIGFGRDYTIALIDKYNAEQRKKHTVYKAVPNIIKEKRNKKSVATK